MAEENLSPQPLASCPCPCYPRPIVIRPLPLSALLAALLPLAAIASPENAPPDGERNPVPPDLIADDAVRMELGVNEFTAPSINRLFEQLDGFGSIAYADLRRAPGADLPADRSQVALHLGTLIADGFAAVQANQLGDIQDIGRDILAHAEALGTGDRVREHAPNLIRAAGEGSREVLRTQLAATQGDVEAEMVELRDVDLAHLISLGGWLRGFQYGCHSLDEPFDAAKVRGLARLDVLQYFREELTYLKERGADLQALDAVTNGLADLERQLDRPRTREFTRRDLEGMTILADALVEAVGSPQN